MNKIKMLVNPSDKHGVGYYRSLNPHEYINNHYDDFDIDIMYEYPKGIPMDEFFRKYDLVHYHKSLFGDKNLVNVPKFLGIPTIMDVDDFWDLGAFHPMSNLAQKQDLKTPILYNVKKADYVTTTTDIFKNEILKYNKNAFVFPNAINPNESQFKPIETKSERLRFGIICGSSHLHDLKILSGMISMIPKDIIDKIQIVLCGFDTNGTMTIVDPITKKSRQRPIRPEESTWADYEKILTNNYSILDDDYKEYLKRYTSVFQYEDSNEPYKRCWTKPIDEYAQHYNNIDVLLVPLKDCQFNKVKSQLKVIEAGFFHKAIIAQNFGPYTIDLHSIFGKDGIYDENGNAILVDTNKGAKQWAKYIEYLVNNRDVVKKLQNNLYETVKYKYSISKVCDDRVNFYRSIVKNK